MIIKKIVTNRTNTIYRNNKNLINPNNLLQGVKEYHLDHKFSIKQGFLNNIPIEIITHPCNLYMMWWEDNLKKQDNCDITIIKLFENIKKYKYGIEVKHSSLNDIYNKENLFKIIEKYDKKH